LGVLRKEADCDGFRVLGGGIGNFWGWFIAQDWPADAVQLADPEQRARLDKAQSDLAESDRRYDNLLAQREQWWENVGSERRRLETERDGYYRQWMSTRETVHKQRAHLDAVTSYLKTRLHELESPLVFANEKSTVLVLLGMLSGAPVSDDRATP
jgi:hypothetical protein